MSSHADPNRPVDELLPEFAYEPDARYRMEQYAGNFINMLPRASNLSEIALTEDQPIKKERPMSRALKAAVFAGALASAYVFTLYKPPK